VRGTSDEDAIPINDLVSAEEFVVFLDFFYQGFVPVHCERGVSLAHPRLSILRKEIPVNEWQKLLVVSAKLDCKEVRDKAIDALTTKRYQVLPVDRIVLGKKYDIPQWLPGAYAEVFVREKHLTVVEGEKLGLEATVVVLKGREKCKRNEWNSSDSSDVTQLVKDLFPGSSSSPSQRKR
jgi:hypothetical protein